MKRTNRRTLPRSLNLMMAFVFPWILQGNVLASVMDEWSHGLGQSSNAVHSFLYEVTFMKIDVAIIEYQLDTETAALAAAIIGEGGLNNSRMERVGDVMMAAETIAIAMDLQRDASCGRVLKGMLSNLKRAWGNGLISEDDHHLVSTRLVALLAPHEERGVLEGDVLMYRIQSDGVRVFLLGVDGDILVDSMEPGAAWTLGIKGIFLGDDSKLRTKLVMAAWNKV